MAFCAALVSAAKVADLDLSAVTARLAREQSLAIGKANAVVQEYRRFLTLKVLRGDLILPPPPLVDTAWHTHILDTPKYHADCMAICGYFIHHTPNEEYVRWSQQTVDMYTSFFKISPPVPIWPPLPGPISKAHVPYVGADVEVGNVDGTVKRGCISAVDNADTLIFAVAFGADVTDHLFAQDAALGVPLWMLRPALVPGGAAVEVNTHDQGVWRRGNLLFVEQGGLYTVGFAPSSVETGIPARAIRVALPDTANPIPWSLEPAVPVVGGMVVEANSRDQGVWHRGEVVGEEPGMRFSVQYYTHLLPEGCAVETNLPASHVRRLSVFHPAARRHSGGQGIPPSAAAPTGPDQQHLTFSQRFRGTKCKTCFGRKSVLECTGYSHKCEICHGHEPCCILACWGGCG